jgi:hypothetical protein
VARIIGSSGAVISPAIRSTLPHDAAETHDIYVRGTGAAKRSYTHSSGAWFYIDNVSDLDNPVTAGSVRDVGATTSLTGANAHCPLTPTSRYFAVTCASGQNRVQLVDTNGDTPVVVATVLNPSSGPYSGLLDGPIDIVVVDGRWGYIACENSDTLLVIDFQTPLAPVIAGVVTHATNLDGIQGIIYDGSNTIYCCANGSKRLTAADITTRNSPAIVGSTANPDNAGMSFGAIHGTTVVVNASGPGNYVSSWDVSDRTDPGFIAGLSDSRIDRALELASSPPGAR